MIDVFIVCVCERERERERERQAERMRGYVSEEGNEGEARTSTQ